MLQKINISTTVNQSRNASSGYTATTGATISEDTISAGQNAYKVGRDFSQSTTHNRQTRLAVLLWLLALALTGVIGFGVYLFMTGRLQLPGQPAIPERGISSEQSSAVAEQKVVLTALNSIQARMTLEEVQTKLDVQLKPYSEISYSTLTSDPPWDSAAVYSCVLEAG